MALAEADLRPDYEQVFRELKLEHRQLVTEIEAAAVPQQHQLADQQEKVDRATALFSKLRATCRMANPTMLRDFSGHAIEKIVIHIDKSQQGRRHRYRLLGGDIHMQLNKLGLTTRCAHV